MIGPTDAPHVVVTESGSFLCRHCGASYAMATPVLVQVLLAAAEAFERAHTFCPQKEKSDADPA